MANGLIETAAEALSPPEQRFYGVAVGQVVNNVDLTGLARVQVKLPWLPGFEPWARVAVLLAGADRGTFFLPQIDDEVLVAFTHGDVREPNVIGCLWNGQDRPPTRAPIDATNKFLVQTPLGHELEFNDLTQTVTVKTITGQTITMDQSKIEIASTEGAAKLTLDVSGNVTLQGTVSISLKAPKIAIEGGTVDIKASGVASMTGGASCRIEAPLVRIN